MSRPKLSPELIDAVRDYAARGKSASETAAELWTEERPLTRNAVIGIAHRNGIEFPRKHRNGIRQPRVTKPKPIERPRPNFVTERAKVWVKPARASCSWAGCTAGAEPGDMFCHSHGRKGLIA